MTMLRRIDSAARDLSSSLTALPAETRILTWGRDLFRSGDGPCPPTIDITGRPRILVFGPYIQLGGGLWRLTARFELCPDAGQYPWLLQFVAGPHMVEESIPPSGAGAYEVSLEQPWRGSQIVEMRLFVVGAAFHGALRFEGVTIERIADLAIGPVGADDPRETMV